METVTSTIQLPEAIVEEILARLPLRSIARFKSVSKTWKSTLESVDFRRLFVSLHKNSSPVWSLISSEGEELIGFHGCKTLDLQKSLDSYVPLSLQYCTASSNGLVLLERDCPDDYSCYVGNPVLQQWVKIPPVDGLSRVIGLVTRVDKDGVVLSFKVVRFKGYISRGLSMCIYSSETGVWTSKIVHCSTLLSNLRVRTLNGTVYFSCRHEPNKLVSHDFYSESDQCRVVPFPEPLNDNDVLTTSGGFVLYISRILAQKDENIFKIWRLSNDESWQLLWEIPITGYFLPVAMHPFDSDIVYLWCYPYQTLVPFNLRTQKERILTDDENQDYYRNHDYRGEIWRPRWLIQFVFPRWMEPVPCPPQVELIDTTSLPPSFPTEKRNRDNNGVF